MKLRDYQLTAVSAIWNAITVRGIKSTICAMPTGVGKSAVNADLAGGIVKLFPDQKILCVTHSQILVGQNAKTLDAVHPGSDYGIVSAGLKLKQYGHAITFAGIGSIYRSPHLLGKINILIVDEAHAISDQESSMYQKLIEHLRKVNENLVIIGLSATPYRMAMGLLTDGDTFEDICVDMTTPEWIAWFVSQGYLVGLSVKKTKAFIDTSDVKIIGGDFQRSGLSNAAMKADMSERAIAEALKHIADRESIAFYCTSIEHVTQVALVLDSYGIDTVVVHSKLTPEENSAALESFNNGEVRAIVSMGTLTTGWDCPRLDCIIVLRPTRSPGLWVQILGRGTRPLWSQGDLSTTEGRLASIAGSKKKDCLVLDFARNTEEIGPFDDPSLPKKRGKGGGEPIMKACIYGKMVDPEYDGCGEYAWPAVRNCKNCGHEYYFEVKFDAQVSGAAVMRGVKAKAYVEPVIASFAVERVVYRRHQKAGKPDSIRVEYKCGIKRFTTYLCPDHGGGATARARSWWRKHVNDTPPAGIDAWLKDVGHALVPKAITVKLRADWPEIIDWEF